MGNKIYITGKDLKIESDTSNAIHHDHKDNTGDLYKRYQECRDQELKRFWENSKYVWTFLGICFAGYGVLLTSNSFFIKTYFSVLSLFVSCVGIILSFLWLKMTQASKQWYEVYENAIWTIESYENKLHFDPNLLIHNFWASKNGDNAFSPSKIMFIIGKILIGVWLAAFLFSLYMFINYGYPLYIKCPCTFGLLLIGIYVLVSERITKHIISSPIRTKNEDKVFQNIKNDINTIFSNDDEYLYFEIIKEGNIKKVVFKFTDNNADKLSKIINMFPRKDDTLQMTDNNSNKISNNDAFEIDRFDLKYQFHVIEKYYKEVEDIIEKIRSQLKERIIIKSGNAIVVFSDDIENDLKLIKKSIQSPILSSDEGRKKIIIPLDCIKDVSSIELVEDKDKNNDKDAIEDKEIKEQNNN
ncbi:MAG: hypothetical protein II939_04205 [Bacteroidales bacterium]|nr:hypothetical protein [Bacteroidales bacterium]